MTTFSPTQTTITEFTPTTSTIKLVQPNCSFNIDKVTYKTSNDVEFDDFKLSWSGDSWTFSSTYKYAVDRVVHYIDNDYVNQTVNNVTKLPSSYINAYCFENPIDHIDLIFTVSGTKVEKSDSESGGSSSSRKSSFTVSYVAKIVTNFSKHIEVIKNAVKNNNFAKR